MHSLHLALAEVETCFSGSGQPSSAISQGWWVTLH